MTTDVLSKHLAGAHALSEHDHHDDHDHDAGGNTVFGFWLYLMTDCIMFACVFAGYAVLVNATAGGPTGKDIFELPYVLWETALLLVSSCTYGFAMLAVHKKAKGQVIAWLLATFVLGAGFIVMEINEFQHLIAHGAGPDRSAFLSSFFALVGMHGLHVTAGLVWMAVMMVLVWRRGITAQNNTRLSCLSLFWHFLDIVWICVFTVVYLMGAL